MSGASRRQTTRRLLCVYQHAPTRNAPGFYRHRHYFSELVRRGWEVDLVSTPVDYLTGTVPAAYANRLYSRETIEGIEHHWAWAATGIHRSRAHRAANYASFAATSAARAATLRRPDLVWASSPPLPVGAVGELLARRFRVPWLFEIRDLWPESAASIGWLQRGSVLYRTLEWLSHRAASHADCVVVPTPGLERDAYSHGAKSVHVIPGVVLDTHAEAERRRVRERLEVGSETCLFAYVGAQGIANGLDIVLDAAKLVLGDTRIAFLLVGDGSDRARLEQRVAEEGIANVTMLGAVPKSEVPQLLAASDVCLHVLRPDPIFRGAQPTKVLEYFGAHRPFITTVDGVPRALAEASGGSFAPTAEALAAEARRWTSLPADERARLNEQAFSYGLSRFGLEAGVDRLESLLTSLIGV